MTVAPSLTHVLLIPVVSGSIFSLLTVVTTWLFVRRAPPRPHFQPPVTVLKPIYGVDRELRHNLESFCTQDYPDYQVVLSLQRPQDPALPLLRELEARYPERVTVVVADSAPSVNGKVQNMVIGLGAARRGTSISW